MASNRPRTNHLICRHIQNRK